jgi:hypothetical protein
MSLIVFHPAMVALFAVLPIAAVLIIFVNVFDQGENYEDYKGQIIVTESQLAFGDTKSSATVVVMGTIKNTSSVPWKDVQFHVDFFDASEKRADVGEKEDYSFHLPANETSSFKVSFRREFPEENYIKHNVRVVTAKDARARWYFVSYRFRLFRLLSVRLFQEIG